MNKFCSNCSKPVETTDEFCGNCGKQLSNHTQKLDLRSKTDPKLKSEQETESVEQEMHENTKQLPIGGPFKYIRLSLKKYVDFSGRSRRAEYWYFVLFSYIGVFVVAFIAGATEGLYQMYDSGFADIVGIVYWLALILPSIGVGVRRLHDTGRSGWWFLIVFIPLGGLVLLIFLLTDGDKKTNKYGVDPKLTA